MVYETAPHFYAVLDFIDALNLAYLVSMRILEEFPAPTVLIHLHNLLVEKGYIKIPIEAWNTIMGPLLPAIFINGERPTSHFEDALLIGFEFPLVPTNHLMHDSSYSNA